MCAKYTETLRDLMLNEEVKILLDKALSTYPLYEPKTLVDMIPSREELNKKLLNHYKYREIGFETVGRFIDELEITMCEIMPHYNELFKTVEIMANIEDPFGNVDVTETFTQTVKGDSTTSGSSTNKANGSSTSNTSANGKSVDSDTPQDQLSIGAENIDSVDYASSAGWTKSVGETSSSHDDEAESTSTGSSESNTETEHTLTRKGNQGVNTYAHDMNEFRTSIIDVVNDILNDDRIAELFMMVY